MTSSIDYPDFTQGVQGRYSSVVVPVFTPHSGTPQTVTYDISAYTTLEVATNFGNSAFVLTQQDAAGNSTDAVIPQGVGFRWAVSGVTLKVAFAGGVVPGGAFLTITGSNRPPAARLDARTNNITPERWVLPGATYATNAVVACTPDDQTIQNQGLCWFQAVLPSTAVGRFEIVPTGFPDVISVTTTGEMATSTGQLVTHGLFAVPAASYSVQFRVTTGATIANGGRLVIVPANP